MGGESVNYPHFAEEETKGETWFWVSLKVTWGLMVRPDPESLTSDPLALPCPPGVLLPVTPSSCPPAEQTWEFSGELGAEQGVRRQ